MSQGSFTVKVEGLAALNRSLAGFDDDIKSELRKELGMVGAIVWDEVHRLAAEFDSEYSDVAGSIRTRIRGTTVSIDSSARSVGGPAARPNLATELWEDAFEKGAEGKEDELAVAFEAAIERLKIKHGF